MAEKHCKIVGTMGPSSNNLEVLTELCRSGLDIVRMNFSHGTHEDHRKNMALVREVAQREGRNIAVLQDLQGPKIRCGQLLNQAMSIKNGDELILQFGQSQTSDSVIPIDYPGLIKDVAVGQRVLMDDGLLKAQIIDIKNDQVFVRFFEGGILKPRKGVNFPDAKLSLPAITKKDTQDLMFGVNLGVNFVALSFVQDPNDVLFCKKIISALGSDIPVIAKIEKLSAIKDIDAIARVSDGLMVARGDLGVEGSLEKVPTYQKIIISAARKYAKPVIVATQMLESMVENPRPTLAEMADVANGVLDGADCLMLSAEMASGKYPVACVQKMRDIILEVESWSLRKQQNYSQEVFADDKELPAHEAIARAACEAADKLNATAIVCLSLTGSIARFISTWRPKTKIIAISPRSPVVNRLSILWGVQGILNPEFINTDALLQELPTLLREHKYVKSGDLIVITAGIPISAMSPTNMLKINKIP